MLRGLEECGTYIVALRLKPVEGLLGAIRTIARNCLGFAEEGVCTTTASNLRLGERDVGR